MIWFSVRAETKVPMAMQAAPIKKYASQVA